MASTRGRVEVPAATRRPPRDAAPACGYAAAAGHDRGGQGGSGGPGPPPAPRPPRRQGRPAAGSSWASTTSAGSPLRRRRPATIAARTALVVPVSNARAVMMRLAFVSHGWRYGDGLQIRSRTGFVQPARRRVTFRLVGVRSLRVNTPPNATCALAARRGHRPHPESRGPAQPSRSPFAAGRNRSTATALPDVRAPQLKVPRGPTQLADDAMAQQPRRGGWTTAAVLGLLVLLMGRALYVQNDGAAPRRLHERRSAAHAFTHGATTRAST